MTGVVYPTSKFSSAHSTYSESAGKLIPQSQPGFPRTYPFSACPRKGLLALKVHSIFTFLLVIYTFIFLFLLPADVHFPCLGHHWKTIGPVAQQHALATTVGTLKKNWLSTDQGISISLHVTFALRPTRTALSRWHVHLLPKPGH